MVPTHALALSYVRISFIIETLAKICYQNARMKLNAVAMRPGTT